jgi:hypothetical protein
LGTIDAWFASFAPVANPQIAVAVLVENQPAANQYQGGTIAAPIAKAVMEADLGSGGAVPAFAATGGPAPAAAVKGAPAPASPRGGNAGGRVALGRAADPVQATAPRL